MAIASDIASAAGLIMATPPILELLTNVEDISSSSESLEKFEMKITVNNKNNKQLMVK